MEKGRVYEWGEMKGGRGKDEVTERGIEEDGRRATVIRRLVFFGCSVCLQRD